jgi:hypothetical protein
MQVHTVISNSRTSDCQFILFSKKNQVSGFSAYPDGSPFQFFRISGSSTVLLTDSTSDCQCILFSKKNPIIRIFCISGWVAVPIFPDKWEFSCTLDRFGLLQFVEAQGSLRLSWNLYESSSRPLVQIIN